MIFRDGGKGEGRGRKKGGGGMTVAHLLSML